MRDFPMFPTEYGVSSLVLKEIPYRRAAYIHIRDVQPSFFREHLEECAAFCRMAGAEHIYAAGHEQLSDYPLYTRVLKMRGHTICGAEHTACLFPVTGETVARWRSIYNERMSQVDNAMTLESRDEKRILDSGGAYFVHDEGKLLGIGWVEENMLLAVAAVERGSGAQVMRSLITLTHGAQMSLEVASTNTRAIQLYESLGFLVVGETAAWYQVE